MWAELGQLDSPFFCKIFDREAAIANALRTGAVPVRARDIYGFEFERIERRVNPASEVLVMGNRIDLRDGMPRECFQDAELSRPELEQWLWENAMDRQVLAVLDDGRSDVGVKTACAETAFRNWLRQQPEMPVRLKYDVQEQLPSTLGEDMATKLSVRAFHRAWTHYAPKAWTAPGRRAKAK